MVQRVLTGTVPMSIHGQKVYKLGNKYYSWDIDKHNGGELKVFERKGGKLERIGTADENLNIYKK